MGNYRTKEDDVAKISTSIFVTNFPESFSAKDLFQFCKQYRHVVDTFIPNKRALLKENNIRENEGGKHKTYSNAPSKDNGFMAKSNSFAQVVKGAEYDFTVEGRIVWVEVEGVSFKLWTKKTFKRIANKWGELLDVDDQEESCFYSR
nr:nucleotide-binding alpha-beta plait domain-containing protein [Tanacetum cinerariifolium]